MRLIRSAEPRVLLLCLAAALAARPGAAQPGAAPPVAPAERASTPAPEEPQHGPARVSTLDSLTAHPGGYWSHAGFGDTVLQNDFATFVFGRMPEPGEEPNPRRNGTLIDVYSDARAIEAFWLTQPTVNDSASLTLAATSMTTSVDETDGSASVTIEHESQITKGLRATTTYKLPRDRKGLIATTTVRNESDVALRLEGIGDFVAWGGMVPFLPGLGWGGGGSVEGLAEHTYARFFESYVMFAADKGLLTVKQSGPAARLLAFGETVLEPAEERTWSRWILAGTDDPASLWNDHVRSRPQSEWGSIAGRVIERALLDDGSIVERDVARDTEVGIRVIKRPDLPAAYATKYYLTTRTDDAGRYRVDLPVGEYSVDVIDPRRTFSPANTGTIVSAGKVAGLEHGVSGAAVLLYEVVDKETQRLIPAKISLVPLRGTRGAILGRTGELQVDRTYYTGNGRGAAEVPVGNYRIVASHGPEYNTAEIRATFKPPESVTARFELERAFTPEGWISADLAVKTSASPNVRTTPEDRLITAAAEGLHWIMTADSGVATDLSGLIGRLGLRDYVRASTGWRTAGETLPLRGDFVVGPLEAAEPDTLAKLAEADKLGSVGGLMDALRQAKGDALLLSKRTAFPEVGFLSALGGTPDFAMVPKGTVDLAVDGVEVWEGKRQGAYPFGYSAYQEIISRGAEVTAFGSSGSSGTWNSEPGYPRIYIKSSTRNPKDLDIAELITNFRQRKVQITNGPFVEVTVNGAGPGETVVPSEPNRVKAAVKVYGADWMSVSRITVNVNGVFSRQVFLPQSISRTGGLLYPREGTNDEAEFSITVTRDSIIEVLVEGDGTSNLDPVNPHFVPSGEQGVLQGQRTLALSAPIFVDFDGDGKIELPPFVDPTKSGDNQNQPDQMDGGPF